mmetsp:Transcript_53633/g.124945  ORF Transcript_53633/g.124945 Transcript_53633/m.124945 type:complete len:264 (-) Transcript_53633:1876-2667(-)
MDVDLLCCIAQASQTSMSPEPKDGDVFCLINTSRPKLSAQATESLVLSMHDPENRLRSVGLAERRLQSRKQREDNDHMEDFVLLVSFDYTSQESLQHTISNRLVALHPGAEELVLDVNESFRLLDEIAISLMRGRLRHRPRTPAAYGPHHLHAAFLPATPLRRPGGICSLLWQLQHVIIADRHLAPQQRHGVTVVHRVDTPRVVPALYAMPRNVPRWPANQFACDVLPREPGLAAPVQEVALEPTIRHILDPRVVVVLAPPNL